MTLQREIAALQARIAAAHAERDGWRATGMQEKYLEAYSTVEALEVQLEALRQEGLRATARNERPVERELTEVSNEAPDARRNVMAELAITFHDGSYRLGAHRYSELDDAVNYARLLRMQGRAAD